MLCAGPLVWLPPPAAHPSAAPPCRRCKRSEWVSDPSPPPLALPPLPLPRAPAPAAGAVPVLVAALQPPRMDATALETVFEAAWAITNLAVVSSCL